MNVINFLNIYGIEKLKEELSIKVSTNDNYSHLYVLNYDQINSPKDHEIVKECRSLVVTDENGKWEIVSAAFDRFFNYGECDYSPNVNDLTCFEKLDGSLVSVFNYKGEWLYRTKSMIMPNLPIIQYSSTWDEFIEEALGWDDLKEKLYDVDSTYIFEVVGEHNRVVVKYSNTAAYLLAVRDNNTLEYYESNLDFQRPRMYNFSSTEECMNAVRNLPNLEEGYVAYNSKGVPVCKIKSPAYLAAHRIRGEGLTPTRIMELVIMNEQDEYLAVFPDDKEKFTDYHHTWNIKLHDEIYKIWDSVKHTSDQKEFANQVKHLPYSSALFQARKNQKDPILELHKQRDSYKIKLLAGMMNLN